MSQRDDQHAFTDIDRAGDPQRCVGFLDAITAMDFIQQYKRFTYEALDVQSGHRVLDAGCGNGDDVRALARLVGPQGRVIGVDWSETVIAEARRRAGGLELPIDFEVGSLYQLGFPEGAFDRCRADRIFHHLEAPDQALAEMVRVTKTGGLVVTFDPDFETVVIDASNRAVTRKVLNTNCDRYQNGWAGRQMPGLFKAAGLTQGVVRPVPIVIADYTQAAQALWLEGNARLAVESGAISAAEAAAWLAELAAADRAGRLFVACLGFIVRGSKA